MIADDEPKIRQGLKSVLEEMKLPITVCAEARNGMEALEKIEQFQPDFILMDICMPKLSGIQFLEELRKLDKNCPVIVISGFNEFSYAKQAIKLGVSEYLLKPIAEEELQAAVVKVTEEIKQKRKSEKFMELVKQQMIQHQDYLRDVFFNEWMEGKLSRFEWEEQARFLDMDFPDNMILILVSVQSSYDKKIDKGTVTEDYTCLIKSDDQKIGRLAGEYILNNLYEKNKKIVVFQGVEESPVSKQRLKGFQDSVQGTIPEEDITYYCGDWLRDRAELRMKDYLISHDSADIVFAFNDDMAYGAYQACQQYRIEGKVHLIGVDGFEGESAGLSLVDKGVLDATIQTPDFGGLSYEIARKLLEGNKVEKNIIIQPELILQGGAKRKE